MKMDAPGAESRDSQKLRIGHDSFDSRLLLGTGKYPSERVMQQALEASGAQIVTVAIRRVDLSARGRGNARSSRLNV